MIIYVIQVLRIMTSMTYNAEIRLINNNHIYIYFLVATSFDVMTAMKLS